MRLIPSSDFRRLITDGDWQHTGDNPVCSTLTDEHGTLVVKFTPGRYVATWSLEGALVVHDDGTADMDWESDLPPAFSGE